MENELINAVSRGSLDDLKQHFQQDKVDKKLAEDLLIGAIVGDFQDIVSFLLDNGVSPNAKDINNESYALHYAANNCRFDIAKLLLERGADVNCVDDYGNLPVSKAVFKRNKCPELMKLLVKHGSDIHKKNNHGVSAQDSASRFDINLEDYK